MSFIGENLRLLRESAWMTCRELAYEFDVHHATISNWESGKLEISDERLEEYADFFGVTIEEIMYGVIR
ncbi:helix-turn-helix domain-containing protein [Ruoffia sp. FAM 24228]|uniref:helix-turn-helix domain-containing protein n=1 Tax=Ruoffia sp. FAM 24228 TaxID=3259517 RepID=UPI00388A3617